MPGFRRHRRDLVVGEACRPRRSLWLRLRVVELLLNRRQSILIGLVALDHVVLMRLTLVRRHRRLAFGGLAQQVRVALYVLESPR